MSAPFPQAFSQSGLKFIPLAALIMLLDQWSKAWVLANITADEVVEVLPSLNLILRFNEGAAFSFLSNAGGWQQYFFISLALVVSVGIVIWLRKLPAKPLLEPLSLNLILAGALGNVIDRFVQGKVTDFIDFYVGSWHYATFNVADMAITLGAIGLLWQLFKAPKSPSAA